MLRRLQRLRAHVHYHSAPRPSNRWSRAMDIAFIASFLMAWPAAWLADLAHHESRTLISLPGILARSADGRADAWLMNGQRGRGAGAPARSAAARDDTIIGNFNLSVTDDYRGWPLVTTIVRQPASLNIDIIAETGARLDVQRDLTDEWQRQIESALRLDGQEEALAAWSQERAHARRQWWAWFPAIGGWWIMQFAVAAAAIQFLRFASLWLSGKRAEREHRRRAEGQCMACGYDMTGLEFNEKCPECGAQVW